MERRGISKTLVAWCLALGCADCAAGHGYGYAQTSPIHDEPDFAEVPFKRPPMGPPCVKGALCSADALATKAPLVHRVEQGQTVYRISRMYGLSVDSLLSANQMSDPRALQLGQLLVIPQVQPHASPPAASKSAEPGPARKTSSDPEGIKEGPSPRAEDAARGEVARAPEEPTLRPPSGKAREPAEARAPAPQNEAPCRNSEIGTSRTAPPALPEMALDWPLRGVLYARFGRKGKEPHDGIDLSAPAGTPVQAAAEGEVLFSGEQAGYGNIVILQHPAGVVTLYAHNRDVRVRTGQKVRLHQVVATVGESGKTSGPHLHFEVRKNGEPKDPLLFLQVDPRSLAKRPAG